MNVMINNENLHTNDMQFSCHVSTHWLLWTIYEIFKEWICEKMKIPRKLNDN